MIGGTKAVPTVRVGMSESALGKADSDTDSGDKDSSVECPTCGREDFKSRTGMKTHHKLAHGESLAGVEATCANCGETVRKGRHRLENTKQVYCSNACNNEHQKNLTGENNPQYNRLQTDCDNCGAELHRTPSEMGKRGRHFCDTECRDDWRSQSEASESPHYSRVEIDCSCCGNTIERTPCAVERSEKLFCDSACYIKWQSENMGGEKALRWKGGEERVKCEMCGSSFEVRPGRVGEARFCSRACQGDWISETYNGEDHPNWKGHNTINYGRNWPDQRKKALSRDGHRCVVCGMSDETHKDEYGSSVHVHHINPIRKFTDNGKTDHETANDLSNLITLCQSCHGRWEGIPLKPQVENSVS